MNAPTRNWAALLPDDPKALESDPRDAKSMKRIVPAKPPVAIVDTHGVKRISIAESHSIDLLLCSMRLRAGLDQKELAQRMGVNVKTVRRVESGHYTNGATLATMRAWAAACGRNLMLEDEG